MRLKACRQRLETRLGPAINTTPVPGGGPQDAWEFNPEIRVDGKTLVFTSLRPTPRAKVRLVRATECTLGDHARACGRDG